MKNNISGLTVEQTRVFDLEAVPFRFIFTPTVINNIMAKYRSGISPESTQKGIPALQFSGGDFFIEKRIIPLNSYYIEERRVGLTISGTSEEADLFFNNLKKTVIETLGPTVNFHDQLVKVEQSSCFVALSIGIEKFFENSFLSFFNKSLPSYNKLPDIKIESHPFSVKIELNYKVNNPALLRSNITVGPKHFIIEKRLQTRPEENIYFITSPFDSSTHLSLIKDLETVLMRKGSLPKK